MSALKDFSVSAQCKGSFTFSEDLYIVARGGIIVSDGISLIKMDGKGGMIISAEDVEINGKNSVKIQSQRIDLN